MGPPDPETLDGIRDTLLAHCEEVVKLDRRAIVRIWHDWHAAYPLEPKQHGAILDSDVVARLARVRWTLYGKHALAAYRRQGGGELLVLCLDSLVGWRCRCTRVPALHEFDANLIVTRPDFAWTLGTSEKWRRGLIYAGPVFATPEMLFMEAEVRRATWNRGNPPWPEEE